MSPIKVFIYSLKRKSLKKNLILIKFICCNRLYKAIYFLMENLFEHVKSILKFLLFFHVLYTISLGNFH